MHQNISFNENILEKDSASSCHSGGVRKGGELGRRVAMLTTQIMIDNWIMSGGSYDIMARSRQNSCVTRLE